MTAARWNDALARVLIQTGSVDTEDWRWSAEVSGDLAPGLAQGAREGEPAHAAALPATLDVTQHGPEVPRMLEDLARVEFALPIVPLVSPRSTIARNGSEFVCEYDARLEQGDDDDAVARAIVSEALAPLRAELSRRLATAALEFGADATARAACVAEAIDVEALAREVRWFAPGAAITRLRPADDPTTDRGKSRRGRGTG